VSGRNRPVENSLLTKHVVAAGNFAKDAGSTPAASTILRSEPRQRCRAEDGALRSFSEGGLSRHAVPSCGWQALRSLDEAGRAISRFPVGSALITQHPMFYAAFETLDLAQHFEHHLKSGSGHAFPKRHLGL